MYDLRCDPVVLATVCPTIDGYGFSFNYIYIYIYIYI